MDYSFIPMGKPIDRKARRVAEGDDDGFVYVFSQKPSSHIESDIFLPFISNNCPFIGAKRGELTVLGWYAERPSRLVAKCSCGKYVVRTIKAMNNVNNTDDACNECRRLKYLISKKSTGLMIDDSLLSTLTH